MTYFYASKKEGNMLQYIYNKLQGETHLNDKWR